MTFENELHENELGFEYIEKYLSLRSAKLLGPIWKTGQIIEFSDAENILDRRVLPLREYKKLISYWYPTVEKEDEQNKIQKIGPKREDNMKVKTYLADKPQRWFYGQRGSSGD